MSRDLMPKSGILQPYVVVSRDAAVVGVSTVDGVAGAVNLTDKYLQKTEAADVYQTKTEGASKDYVLDSIQPIMEGALFKADPFVDNNIPFRSAGANGVESVDMMKVTPDNSIKIGSYESSVQGVEIHSAGRLQVVDQNDSGVETKYPVYSKRFRPEIEDLPFAAIGSYVKDSKGRTIGVNRTGINSDIKQLTQKVTFTQPISVADAVDATNAVNLGQISSDQGASLIGTLEGVPVQNIISNINTDIIQLKLNWAIENGYSDAGFTFTTGGTLTVDDRDKVVYDPVSKTWYSYAGALPVVVPAGFNPVGNADWKPQTDPDLRTDLASNSGSSMVGTSNGMTVQQIIERGTIYIDDLPGVTTDGSADCAEAINSLLNQIKTIPSRRWVVQIRGTRGATYRLDSTIDTTGISNLEIDFGLATILDNVQGVLSTGRSNHTFLIYNNKSVKIKNIIYTVSPTRSNNVSVTDISTCPFWIGGQYLGDAETIGTVVENFYAVNASLDKGMVAAVMGETRDFHLKNFFISGGTWRFGVDIEWGTAPVDPSTDETDTNGRHPHDGVIESFNGEKLGSMEGFLRTAAGYNIKFLNCNGVDVKGFIYLYSGDKGIARCSNNITFENCKGRLTSFTSGVTNLVHIRYIDNLNGTSLPAYINSEAFIHFLNCEFVGNLSNPTACVRLIGNKGRTKFENCAFRGAYHGINADNNADVTYTQNMSLELSGCTFSNNFIHLRIARLTGYRVSQCKFLAQASTATTYGVVIGSAANFGVFDGNYFSGANAQPHVGVSNGLGTKFYNNVFIPYNATTPQIDTDVIVYGQNNYYSGGILLRGGLTDKRMIGEPSTGVKSVDLIVGNAVSFESADFLTSRATATVNAIVGGVNGGIVRFRGVAVASSVTFQHAASGVSLGTRLVLKSGSDMTATGNAWSMTFIHTDNGWYEI